MRGRNRGAVKRSSNRISCITVIMIMLVFTVIIAFQIKSLSVQNERKNTELSAKQEAFEQESKRTEQLEEQRVYVQTKKYVEEEAKKIGYVYPDEIILKPEEKN